MTEKDQSDLVGQASTPSSAMESLSANLQENFGVNPASQGAPNITPPPTPPPVPPAVPTVPGVSSTGDSGPAKNSSSAPTTVPNLDSFSVSLTEEKADYSSANRGVKDVSKKLPNWSLEPPESYMQN